MITVTVTQLVLPASEPWAGKVRTADCWPDGREGR